jgi:hypothetical protein
MHVYVSVGVCSVFLKKGYIYIIYVTFFTILFNKSVTKIIYKKSKSDTQHLHTQQ